jgi:hypothetical protein
MQQDHFMQPAKHIPIPAGATHFSPAHVYPFEQWMLDGQRYVFITDEGSRPPFFHLLFTTLTHRHDPQCRSWTPLAFEKIAGSCGRTA